MRVLFSCNPMVGHLFPMIELAATLRDDGHEVAVLSAPALAAEIGAAGLDHVAAGPSFDTIVGEALTRYPDTPFDTPEDQQRFGFERLFSEIRVELALPESLTATVAFAPDLIVNEVADSVGPGGDPDAITGDRSQIEVRRFVPQGAVLDQCSLAVAHGGVGTTVGALSFGVPLVLIPMGADQAENAEQVVTSGAGRMIERAELDAGRVTTVVTEVLAADELRAAAARLRAEIAAMPPPSALVGVLEELAAAPG